MFVLRITGMKLIIELVQFLPKYIDLENDFKNEKEALFIFKLVTINMEQILCNYQNTPLNPIKLPDSTQECCYLIESLSDKTWERIHTGHFSEVDVNIRKLYTVANYFKSLDFAQLEKCCEIYDQALLIGCTQNLYSGRNMLEKELAKFLDTNLGTSAIENLPYIPPIKQEENHCDIRKMRLPSVKTFYDEFFVLEQPVLLLDTIDHWPALDKWRDLNYILKVAGNRTVPIEIGSNYSTKDWSQQLIRMKDFLSRQFGHRHDSTHIEYLAQHELFDQVPALKKDIRIPDYCLFNTAPEKIDIKAWLGPKGTISPMHFDAKHNILCQVFGSKKIILASPFDSEFLYPHESKFLNNTSQIDAEHVDTNKFPLITKARMLHLTLQEGECVYIPPKWWHYVRSLSESFSVSFWWQ